MIETDCADDSDNVGAGSDGEGDKPVINEQATVVTKKVSHPHGNRTMSGRCGGDGTAILITD